jgi:ceramide glucosyltransferase
LATCLYRARGDAFPARFEALGVATEFAPSVLVARALGMEGFALGSTMVFRRKQLRAIGGFEAVREYLADDYQLGRRIGRLGYRVELATAVVETELAARTFADVWRHQVRWARTIRVSRPGGYFGYVVTQAALWSVLALLAGYPGVAAAAMAARAAAGIACGWLVLRDPRIARMAPLMPLRDLFGFAVWIAGLFPGPVEWRGRRLQLSADGRIAGEIGHERK